MCRDRVCDPPRPPSQHVRACYVCRCVLCSSSPTKLCLDVVQSHNQILHYFGDLCVLQCTVVASSVNSPGTPKEYRFPTPPDNDSSRTSQGPKAEPFVAGRGTTLWWTDVNGVEVGAAPPAIVGLSLSILVARFVVGLPRFRNSEVTSTQNGGCRCRFVAIFRRFVSLFDTFLACCRAAPSDGLSCRACTPSDRRNETGFPTLPDDNSPPVHP